MALGFFQQQATDEVRGNLIGELGEEEWVRAGRSWAGVLAMGVAV